MPGEDPVEEGAADVPDMQVASRRRRKPDSHLVGSQIPEYSRIVSGRGLALAHCSACFDVSSGRAPATGLVRVPMPSISTLTSCPGSIGPTPDGVPVKITSPGNRVVYEE